MNRLRQFELERIRDEWGLLCNGVVYLRGDELPVALFDEPTWARIDYRRLNRAERRYAVGRRTRV